MNTTLDDLLDLLADEKAYKDIRRPDMPSFIFFDDDKSMTEEDRAFREMAQRVEEIKAAHDHIEAITSGKERHARIKQVRRVPARDCTECHSKADTVRAGYIPQPTTRDKKRAAYLTRRVQPTDTTFKEVEDDFEDVRENPTVYAKGITSKYINEVFKLFPEKVIHITKAGEQAIAEGREPSPGDVIKVRDIPAHLTPEMRKAIDAIPIKPGDEPISIDQAHEDARRCRWLIGWHKRMALTGKNDHWRELVKPLVHLMDDPKQGHDATTILRTLRNALPFAPGPVNATTFVNPDGSKHTTAGTNYGSAKAEYIKRHKLEDDFVTVDRVQYENERTSKLVVGTRKRSDETLSNYFDPSVEIEESSKRDWRYQPSGSVVLHRMPKSRVFEGYCLTIRELEQCIIAGATLVDDDIELTAESIRNHNAPEDTRTLRIELGDGKEARDRSSFDYIEEYIYNTLRSFGMDRIAELVEMRDPALLQDQVTRNGQYVEEFSDLLQWVHEDDVRNQSEDPSYEPMLPHVIGAFTAHERERKTNVHIESITRPKELGYGGEPHFFDQVNAMADYMEKRNGQRWAHLAWKES